MSESIHFQKDLLLIHCNFFCIVIYSGRGSLPGISIPEGEAGSTVGQNAARAEAVVCQEPVCCLCEAPASPPTPPGTRQVAATTAAAAAAAASETSCLCSTGQCNTVSWGHWIAGPPSSSPTVLQLL